MVNFTKIPTLAPITQPSRRSEVAKMDRLSKMATLTTSLLPRSGVFKLGNFPKMNSPPTRLLIHRKSKSSAAFAALMRDPHAHLAPERRTRGASRHSV
jgi:hypothetical protein